MQNLVYHNKTVIGRLHQYFSIYFQSCCVPTANNLFLFALAIIALESADSIRFLYRHFICKLTTKSLNAFYYTCAYAQVDYSTFMRTTARIAMRIIPKDLADLPIFLCIDDTMAEKFGKKFDYVSKLFDHAAHNGSNYLNGHCFVSLMLCVPVWENQKIVYKGIPLGYRMWKKNVSKLSLAADMVRYVMKDLLNVHQVVILADSWYGKSEIFGLKEEFDNLDVICNVRRDTVLYDLAPERTGKKGRPATHGGRLSIDNDFVLSGEKMGDYFVAHRPVLTNLLKKHIMHAFVTAPNKDGGRWLFLSTVDVTTIRMPCAWMEKAPLNQCNSRWADYIPLFWYDFRWNIEVSYYEQKTFWSLCQYMVRHAPAIELIVNLICTAYSAVKLLPYADQNYTAYRGISPQEFRFVLSEQINEQVFWLGFLRSAQTDNNSVTIINTVKLWLFAKASTVNNL